MESSTVRQSVLRTVVAALEPHAWAIAAWEGGSASFGRVDEWSDIDLQVAVDDDSVEAAFAAVEEALPPVDLRYRMPEPTWHGHSQAFYRFADAPPTLLLDLAVMRRSTDRRFNQLERHGEPQVLFDKEGWIQVVSLDAAEHEEKLRARVADLKARFEMFQPLVSKALERGDPIEALAFYQTQTWRPLVEMLRIAHDPARHDFGPRYLHHDLPADIVARIRDLAFVTDAADLAAKHAEAVAWFRKL